MLFVLDSFEVCSDNFHKELSERTNLLITNPCKGGAVVIWETKDYINEANRQLNVTSNYKKLSNDPVVARIKLINNAIDRFKEEQLIPKETSETVKLKDPGTPKFNLLLIIHKINNPGRPFVSSIGCHITKVSYISDGYCTEFNIYFFILYLF